MDLRRKFRSDCRSRNDSLNFCFSQSLSLFSLPQYLPAPEHETSDINMTHEDTWSDLFMCNEFRAAVWCSKKSSKPQRLEGKREEPPSYPTHTDGMYTHTVNFYIILICFWSSSCFSAYTTKHLSIYHITTFTFVIN